jgi:hypothetical protein
MVADIRSSPWSPRGEDAFAVAAKKECEAALESLDRWEDTPLNLLDAAFELNGEALFGLPA